MTRIRGHEGHTYEDMMLSDDVDFDYFQQEDEQMYKNASGDKVTAKGKAQELLAQAINRACDDPDTADQKLTEREHGELVRHMETIGDSLLKKLHQPLRADAE